MTPVMCGSAYQEQGRPAPARRRRPLPAEPDGGRQRGARPEQGRGEGRRRLRPDQAVRRPRVQAAAGQVRPAHLLPRLPGHGLGRRHHLQHRATRCGRCASRACSACTRTTARRFRRPRPATSSRSTASRPAPARRSPTARSTCTLTSMHVPAAVISLAVAPKDRVGRGELLQGAQPLHEGRPDLPRAPGRGVAADHHQRHGRAPPRHLHGAHAARVQLRGHRGQAAGGLPRDDHAAARRSTTRTRSRPAAPASTRKIMRLHRAAPGRRGRGVRVRRRRRRRVDPARVHPGRATRASRRAIKQGHADRVPRSSASACAINDGAVRTRSTRPKWRSRPPRSWASARPTRARSRPSSSPS